MALTIQEILDADDVQVEEVQTPEWGGSVFCRSLTGDQRDRLDQIVTELQSERDDGTEDWAGTRAAAVAMGICDESGQSQNVTEIEIKSLGKKNGAALQRCFDVIRRLSGMNEEAIEDAEKN